jgi:hypothetical protein
MIASSDRPPHSANHRSADQTALNVDPALPIIGKPSHG